MFLVVMYGVVCDSPLVVFRRVAAGVGVHVEVREAASGDVDAQAMSFLEQI